MCDKEDIILAALIYHKFKQRSILPKARYEYPKSKINLFKLKINELEDLFQKSDMENIVKCLAVELGLGGVYSEEICFLSKIDKLKKPTELNEKEIKKIFENINNLKNKKLCSVMIYNKEEIIDVVPFDLEFYKNYSKEKFDSFSKALESYFKKFIEKKPNKYEKQLNKLKEIIKKQELKIEELKIKELEEREKAELMYTNYNLIKEIIEQLNKASEKYSWKEIKEKLKNHKIINDIDSKEKKIVLEMK